MWTNLGQPTQDTAEAQGQWSISTHSTGGESHGFIVIILSNPTYATLEPIITFITPVQPGPLRVAEWATQYQIALAKTIHEKATQTFQT